MAACCAPPCCKGLATAVAACCASPCCKGLATAVAACCASPCCNRFATLVAACCVLPGCKGSAEEAGSGDGHLGIPCVKDALSTRATLTSRALGPL